MQAVFIIWFSARSFHNVKAWKWFKLFLGASFAVSVSRGAQNGPKMRCTKFYEKSIHPAFLIFCMNLQQHKGLKLNQMFFLGNFLCWGFWAKKRSKMSFFTFNNNSLDLFFLIFCTKLQWYEGWKMGKIILTKFLFQGFWGKKTPKGAQNEVF